jgi:hypothetical protein
MQSIIVPSGNDAHANPDQAARQRADRLAVWIIRSGRIAGVQRALPYAGSW